MTTVLKTEDLRKRFGELTAVDDVSIEIDDDKITSIIGPNGAGKTTFYNLLTGVLQPTSGSIWLRSEGGGELADVTDAEPHEVAQAGLSRSYQITNIFEGLTVRENVRVARISHEGTRLDFRSRATADESVEADIEELLDLTGLTDIADTPCDTLSHGEKRTVEIALALAIEPNVFLLDEPTAGMNPTEVTEIVSLIRELDADLDATFVVTEHNMDVVTDISDRIVVLAEGAILADGSPEDVLTDERVTEAYLGSDSV
ncbi:ABC transporter [Halorubrum californiense DSM 19288]|uniref:Probable branched-chain amino acid transport ATP-binding protein LivG n=1 Tax=Halorubrum californiense DSM 19288 TaxID=1227465 RepID=M0DZP7_9EURY|nr:MULTISPECIES: ABC transporter ATP-binding protein [Halorubrum]ELZ40288.1 ABC transporter [Halorubrum californiense DSM 19288]TKX68136.1 ABC transporter ATP-binding protein [Halorubrum sp. GN11GM_10-3_MGM]